LVSLQPAVVVRAILCPFTTTTATGDDDDDDDNYSATAAAAAAAAVIVAAKNCRPRDPVAARRPYRASISPV